MSSLVDANNKPLKNGQNHDKATGDVRAVPTGTLIYNLIRYTGEELGMENALHQLEHVKQQQKMVNDPPQMAAVRAHHAQMVEFRYIIANELNERFAAIDKKRCEDLGIEIIVPAPPPAPAPGTPES